MPQAWVPSNGPTRRIIAAISAALLAFTLVVALPVVAPGAADTAHAAQDACGVDVLFVLDESGSMEGVGETAVRTGFKAFIDELKVDAPDSNVGIVEFNTTSRLPFGTDWKNVVTAEAELKNYIDDAPGAPSAGYEAENWTNWEDAMTDALAFTNANTDKPDFVVVITDGNPTTYVSPGDVGNPNAVPGSNPTDTATMWNYGAWEAINEYTALAGQIAGSDTIIGFGAGANFGDAATKARLGEIVDVVTTVSPLSALADEIADLAAEVCAPKLDIEKSTNGQNADSPTGPTIPAGDAVNWTYEVTNTGPVTVYDITVTDDDNDGATISCPGGNGSFDLDPGESETCTASSISWYTRDHKQHSNTATAEGTDADQNDASDTDPSHYKPTLVCPFDATGDQILIDIFGNDPTGDGGFLLNNTSTVGPIAVNVPAGHYNVSWASYDAHEIKGEPNPGQTEEVWYLNFSSGSSADTADIPWNSDFAQGTLGSIMSLGSAETEVTINHGAAGAGTNSVHAICALLDPIDPADIDVTKTLLSSGDLYDGDTATFEVKVSNGSDDEALNVTTLTENIGGSDLNLLLANPGAPIVGNTCDNVFPTSIAPNSSATCQFTITVSADMTSASDDRCDADQKIDVVTGAGVGELTGDQVSDDDCEDITINPDPIITVNKVDNGPGTYYDGAEVTFDVSITNNSDTESVTIDTLTDDVGDAVINLLANPADPALASNTCNTNPSISIAPGGVFDCEFSIIVSSDMGSADHQECPSQDDVVDVVAASGLGDDSDAPVSDDDCETITVNAKPEIEVTKTLATTGELYDGSNATFDVKIENLSTTESVTIDTLTEDFGQGPVDLTVLGDFETNTCADLSWPLTIAASGEATCSFTIQLDADEYTGTTHDECDNGGLVNVVAADGSGDAGQLPVADDDCEEITISDDPVITLDKSVSDVETEPAEADGSWITYDVTIGNESTTEAVEVTSLTDAVDGSTFDLLAADGTYAAIQNNTCNDTLPLTVGAGEQVTCSFDFWVDGQTTSAPSDECDTGDVVDVVTGEVVGVLSGATDTADDCAEINVKPDITVNKSTDTPQLAAPGGPVTFDVSVTNNTIHSVTLTSLMDSVDGGTAYDITDTNNVNWTTCDLGVTIDGGATYDCQFNVDVMGNDGETIQDIVTGEACDDAELCDEDDDYEDVTINDVSIDVDKSTDTPLIVAKGDAHWIVVVTNDGDWPLTNVRAFDLLESIGGNSNLTVCEELHRDVGLTTAYDSGILEPGDKLYAECESTHDSSVDGTDVTNNITAVGDAWAPQVNVVLALDPDQVPVGCDDDKLPSHDVCDADDATVPIVPPTIDPFARACEAIDLEGAEFNLDIPILQWDSSNWNTPGDTTYFDPATDTLTLKIWDNTQDPNTDAPALTYEVPYSSDLLGTAPYSGAAGAPTADRLFDDGGVVGLEWPGYDNTAFNPDMGLEGIVYPGPEYRPIFLQLGFNPASGIQELSYPDATADCEPGGEVTIDKKVFDPSSGLYVDLGNLPSSTTFPATVEWQITVGNPTPWLVQDVYLTDANAPACEADFVAAMEAIEAGKDFLHAFESVTFTCNSDVPSVPAVNTAVAGGQDVWDRDLPEVSDDAAVVQVLASATIGDTVWYDTNDNGVQDGAEEGISGTPVKLTGLDGQDVDPVTAGVQTTISATTGVDGKYLFSGLPDGNYKVEVALSSVPNPDTLALRFTTASSFTIVLPDGGSFLDADFGVIADELPVTGIDTDSMIVVAILLLVAGSIAVLVARREDEVGAEAKAA